MSPRSSVFVVGTRAQLIKVAPVLVACERMGHPALLLMTGQHKETMQDLVEEFGITSPQVTALAATERATVGSLLNWLPRAYRGVQRELGRCRQLNPRLDVIVHGDTLSTVVGAVAGRRSGARVIHVESGLTSGRWYDPFPEELSRRLVFRNVDVAMCPHPEAAELMRRRYRCQVVDTVGNTILDAVHLAGAIPAAPPEPYVVASLHRFQNLYSATRLRALVEMLVAISERIPVHFVLHPATRLKLVSQGLLERLAGAPGIRLSPRLGYRAFLQLAASADCVLTDGGSNQEELAALGVPTIVMRERTERPDGLGANARMEADLAEGVVACLLTGDYRRFRMAPSVGAAMGPSQLIAQFLAAD